MNSAAVTALRGLVDALLEPEDDPVEVVPRFVLPRLSMSGDICHSDQAPTDASTLHRTVPASAYLTISRERWLLGQSCPRSGMEWTTYLLGMYIVLARNRPQVTPFRVSVGL